MSIFIQVHAFTRLDSEKHVPVCVMAVYRSAKVVDFSTNRKRACDFLLEINSNLVAVLHHRV